VTQQSHYNGVTFINAEINAGTGGGPDSLRTVGSRIAALGCAADSADRIVDLDGDRLLPGLINAHDHLQLNTLPPIEGQGPWKNVREWISAINVRRQTDRAFESLVAVPRDERLFMGGVKNLLSGVTTVAHHDPLYAYLTGAQFPIRVVAEYGWSHSLLIDGDEAVRAAFRATPADWPWIIHAAEGVDEEAAGELSRLDALGCVGSNTVLVHGVALDEAQRARLESASAALVWCPSSNIRLLGRTAEVRELAGRGRVALGTDSRLSGSRDLLCELGVARAIYDLDEVTLESLVTRHAAAVLRLPGRGSLTPGAYADLLVLPAGMPLSRATRSDVRLVMLGGEALYADADYARVVAPATHWTQVRVDGKTKMLAKALATALSGMSVGEDGLEISPGDAKDCVTARRLAGGAGSRHA
jgi:cytosine/adenosine deaminase-related metal-dependent hydrolase